MKSFYELLDKIPSSLYSRESGSDVNKLFQLYAGVFDELKAVAGMIGKLRSIEDQAGAVLDEIGKIVKEPRRGLSDDQYRGYLYIAILRNTSSGSISTVSRLVHQVLGKDVDNFTVRDLHNLADTKFDANGFFDGKRLLNPGHSQPAAFDVHVPEYLPVPEGSEDEPEKIDIDYLAGLINEIKSAGVKADVKLNTEV